MKAADDISLDIMDGEFVSLLGPSGCGKTTTLRMIAGFAIPDAGRILLKETDITNVPPHLRDIGMVFQDYALWPHMTVMQHMTFGLKLKGVPSEEMTARTKRAVSLVHLEGLERRYPKQLSGGQQQRVALARALVMEPKVLLLDEPLSNLDRKLRDAMKMELRRLQKMLGITMIFVTHDQSEALALSDKIVVMNRGAIAQIGSSEDVYENPGSVFVAGFIGSANFIECTVKSTADGYASVEVAGRYRLSVPLAAGSSFPPGVSATIFLRPSNIELAESDRGDESSLPLEQIGAVYEGSSTRVLTRIKGSQQELTLEVPSGRYNPNTDSGFFARLLKPRLLSKEAK